MKLNTFRNLGFTLKVVRATPRKNSGIAKLGRLAGAKAPWVLETQPPATTVPAVSDIADRWCQEDMGQRYQATARGDCGVERYLRCRPAYSPIGQL